MDARLLVILSLVAAATAGPWNKQITNKCTTQCMASTKYNYNPGTTYVYDYRVDTESSIFGAFENSARLTIQTSANIEVLSQCEFALQLSNTKVFHSDASGALKSADRESEFRSEVEGTTLRFSFQNGIIDHVCAESDDSVRSLNFKKGILSAFQNSMDDLTKNKNVTETDVSGTCKAEYKLVSNGYYTTEVKKVKNMLSCTDRLDFLTLAQATPYKLPSDLQSLPIMKTTHECDQAFENGGVLKSSVCKESHIYRPFANGQNGGSTKVTQTLTYQTYRRGVSQTAGMSASRSSMLFDHSADHLSKEQSRISVERKVNEICDTTRYDIRPETPRLFSDLISVMKGLDKQDLTELHRLLKTKSICPTNGKAYKFFHDALPMLGSPASVSLMTELINDKDVSGLEATAWLSSLAFIQYPTSSMLLDAKTLIDNVEARTNALLPVSSMINNFCKMTGTCSQDYAVLRLMSSIEKNIDSYCDASGDRFELTLLTLKAIGNAGHTDSTISILNKCLKATSNPLEIQIAAAEAFRRMPCSEDRDLWETLEDKVLDSELRIHAYLALMRCPSQQNLARIAGILFAEDDEQVGAFIYSHLTNLRESSDPHKQDVADAINNLALNKEFELSTLKFSRNFEVSGLLNKINTGVTAESNLIWSNKVQLPRAMSANLTVQLFGQSINLLDFGGRFEGLEYIIKKIVEPYMKGETKSNKLDMENVKGSIYGRLFGNELLFMHSKTTKKLFGDKRPSWLEMLIKMADDQHVALTQTVQFMDVCLVIPTSAGLPLHMRVNGTATVDLNMNGKMDLRKIGASPRSMTVDGEIKPSAAVELTGSMFVDAFITKTGLRMRNNMHTSTAIKGRIVLNRGHELNVELDTPEEKMEIFGASSKFVLLHDDMEQEQEMIKENRKEFQGCSNNQLTKITGMEICGELSFPNASMKADSPYFPFTGPSSVSVTLYKRDSHSSYKLFAKRVENKKASTAQFLFNTPGSKINRAMSLDMSLNYKKQELDFNMATPWKQFSVNGNMINTKKMKSLSGRVVVDEKDTYAMTGEVKVTDNKRKVEYNPIIELRRPGVDNIAMTGYISMEKPMKGINMELSLSGLTKIPYVVKSTMKNTVKEKSVEAGLTLEGKNKYSVLVSNINSANSKSTNMENTFEVRVPERRLVSLFNSINYKDSKSLRTETTLFIYRLLKKQATLKANFDKVESKKKKSLQYKSVIDLKSQQIGANVHISLNKKSKSWSFNNKLNYNIPKVSKDQITLNGKVLDRSTPSFSSYIIQSNFQVRKNTGYNNYVRLDIGHKKQKNLSTARLDWKYGGNQKTEKAKIKKIYIYTTLGRQIDGLKKAVFNYTLKADAKHLGVQVALKANHFHSKKQVDSNVRLTYAPKKEIKAGIILQDDSSKLMKMNGDAYISWPGKKYQVETDLNQKSGKMYTHSLTYYGNAGTRHSIMSVYKMPKSNSHDLTVDLNLHKMKPVTISGSTSLNWRNFAASGEYKRGQDVYGINAASKFSPKHSKINFELAHPARRITVEMNGKNNHNKYEGDIEAAWDADNDKSKKMSLNGVYFQKSSRDGSVSYGGNMRFNSPFEQYDNLFGSFRYGNERAQHSMNGKFSWAKGKSIASTLTVTKPISFSNIDLKGDIKTPFRGFRNAEINIDHKLDSGLSTTLKGSLGKETAKLTLEGSKLENGFKGNMNIKSTIKNAESLSLSASHIGKEGGYDNKAELNHNGKVYAYDLTMSHFGEGWNRKCNGNLLLNLNKQQISTHWDHKNTDCILSTTLNSKWNNKRLIFDLSGSHRLNNLRSFAGIMKIKSPWEPIKNIELNLDHKHGKGLINSIAFFKQGSKEKALSNIQYNRRQNIVDFDFKIVSPFSKEALIGKLNTNYNNYPMTTSAELQWSPKMKGTLEGSIDLISWNNADLDVKMTTPSQSLRTVALKASNKEQNGELVSHLNLDYGIRQNIELESRLSNEEEKKMFRLKLSSPFKQMKSLSTGFNFNGKTHDFDATADFELKPVMVKFDGALNWKKNKILNGKLRVDTPFKDYPYFELSTSRQKNAGVAKAHIQAEYHPKQVFRFDTNYKFDLPLTFDATIKSPFPEFNNIGMSFQHNQLTSSIKTQGEVQYQPGKKIKADFDADWASDLESNLVVKTPFAGYETNKVNLRHRGQMDKFESHGEIDVAKQIVVVDASFSGGKHTSAGFSLSSPIPGAEKIEFVLKKKGHLNNLRGSASIDINEDKFKTTFNNKITKGSLKSKIDLMTPYTEKFEISLDHSGILNSFTNKFGLSYGRKVDIDTQVIFDLRRNDVNGKGFLKYKMFKTRNTGSIIFTQSGSLNDFSVSTSTSWNKDDITVTGSLKTIGGIDGSIQIKTPFKNFKNPGMTLTYSGDLSEFNGDTNIKYMDNRNINGKIYFSTRAGIKMSGDLTTPFQDFESTVFEFNHDQDVYSVINGNGKLTTNICEFGTGDFTYKLSGDLDNFAVSGSVSYNGENMADFKNTHNMQNNEIHSMVSLTSVITPDAYLSLDHSGDRYSFNTKAIGKLGKNRISSTTDMKTGYETLTFDSSVSYNMEDEKENKASINIQRDGPLDNGRIEMTGKLNAEEVKMSASRSGPLNNILLSGSATYGNLAGIYHSAEVTGRWKNTNNIEGSLKLLTSFEDLKNFDIFVTHTGEMADFFSTLNVNYLDNKINGDIEFRGYTLENVKFVSKLATPFEGLKHLNLKFNNNYNKYNLELSGNAAIDTSIADFGTADISYSKTGNLLNLNVKGNGMKNGVEVAEMIVKNSAQDGELHFSLDAKSILTSHVIFTVDHNGDLSNMKTSAVAKIGNKNVMKAETTFTQNLNIIDGEAKITYNIQEFGNDMMVFNIHKQGILNRFNVELSGRHGSKTAKITGSFKNEDSLGGDLTINTPIVGYKNVGFSFSHVGTMDKFNCEGKMAITDGEEFTGKVDFYRHQYQRIEAVVELRTPISDYEFTKYEYRHEGESDGFTCSSSLEYGNDQRISYDLSASAIPKPQVTLTVKLPQQEFMTSGSYENAWPKYSIDGKVDAGEGRIVTLSGSFDASRDIVGVLTLSTPVEDFNNVGINFHHSNNAKGISSEGSITYKDDKSISGKIEASISKKVTDVSLEVKTPFTGIEYTRYEVKHNNNKMLKKLKSTLSYGDRQRIVVDTHLKFKGTPEFSLTISSPFTESDIEAYASLDNSWPKGEFNSKLIPGNSNKFSLDGSFDATQDISGSIKIETPFTGFGNVGMNFIHSGNTEKFATEGKLNYMDGQELFGKVNFYRYMWRRIDASMEMTTPFNGLENNKVEFNFENNPNSISTTTALEYNNGQKLNGNVKITYSPAYEVLVTLNTPFDKINVVRAQSTLDLTAPNYEVTSSLSYGYNQAYAATGKLNLQSIDNLDGSFEVNTPFDHYESTKVEYRHKVDSSEIEGSVTLTYDDGKKMNCEVKSVISPNFDGTITLNTPFSGYERLQASANFDTSYKRYETKSSLILGQSNIFSISSELDYSIEPMRVSTKINTPFNQFRNIDMELAHEGDLYNFKSTGSLSSPITSRINGQASLRYFSLYDMSASASLQSSLEGFDDLKAEWKTSDIAGEMKNNAMFGWTSGQQISYDATFSKQEGWNGDNMHADVSISTPFTAVHSVNVQMDHTAQTDSFVEKMNFQLNGDSLLDFDAEYNFNDKKSAELIVRQPWPMQYTASKSNNGDSMEAELFANWNRNKQDSNVRMIASLTDKSTSYEVEKNIDFSVKYSARKVGFVNKFSQKSSDLLANGYVYWDSEDDSKVSYDLKVNNNSRRRKQMIDGSFKLGLPSRTLGWTGSFSENAALTSTDSTFSWDADRDETQQVGIKTNVRYGEILKGDVTLSLPTLRKEIRVDSQIKMRNGRVILDTTTDISYSKDSRKTLTLTSKLEDLSSRNSFNYSLALGVKHPYTNVDIELNSHLGASDEKMTFGMATNYMTSKRQIKNLALLSEINMLKKQISVQAFNPLNNLEVVGDVISENPLKLRMINKIDDVESFRSDMTFDTDKKSFIFNTFYGSDGLTLEAKYPNQTAFQVALSHHTPSHDQEDALIAMRLNTSHLLHTRLAWRPDMLKNLKEYALPIAVEKAESAIVILSDLNEAIAEELGSKYAAIVNELNDEMIPLVKELEKELEFVTEKMNEISQELKVMYNNNNFYLQNMGEGVLALQAKLEKLIEKYTSSYKPMLFSLKESLEDMTQYHMAARYKHFVKTTLTSLMAESMSSLASLELYMAEADMVLNEYKNTMLQMKKRVMDTVLNATFVDYLAGRVHNIQTADISPYISSFNIPSQYTNIASSIPSRIHEKINNVLDSADMTYVKEGLNEVYQQGLWTYNYWQIEENVQKHIESILSTLKEIMEEELKEYAHFIKNNVITVWDPKDGEIQAEIPLPITVRRLDQIPDLKQLEKKIEKLAQYLPDQTTWNKLVKSAADMWPVQSKQSLNKYKPNRRYRKKGRKNRAKSHRQ